MQMLTVTVPGGKMNRGLSVAHSFQLIRPNATPEDIKLAHILGWCVEWVGA